MRYAIAFGSNLGDRLENLCIARGDLRRIGAELRCSSVYLTQPVDCTVESDAFYNAVGIYSIDREPDQTLRFLQQIEAQLGRAGAGMRAVNSPRPIDLDILFVDDLEIREPDLVLPHPRWSARDFVLVPLAELLADTVVVGQTRSVGEILASLPEGEIGASRPQRLFSADEWQPDSPT